MYRDFWMKRKVKRTCLNQNHEHEMIQSIFITKSANLDKKKIIFKLYLSIQV